MTLDELRDLAEKIRSDASQVSDEQLAAASDAIQEQVAQAREAGASPDTVKLLTDLKAVKEAVDGEAGSRASAAAELEAEAASLFDSFGKPADGGEGGDESNVVELPVDRAEQSEPVAVAASGVSADLIASITKAAIDGVTQAFAAKADKVDQPEQPQGRTARVATTATPARAGEFVTAKVFGGQDTAGAPIDSSYDLAKSLHDKFRTVYQDSSFSGRIPVAHVAYEYPESRKLGSDAASNFNKLEALTAPQALTAAGGLCAPLTPDYNVEVVGTSARPIRDQAMVGVQVERGGLMFRPPLSGAAAVNGAGQWTLDDDEAASVVNDTGPIKQCFEVDCPGMTEEYIWAAYLCLEFSNITTRFDPETTAANLRQGDIAHSRLAENLLLSKMAAGSKLLSGARVIGATRDILVNVDKSVSYLRSRHRIDEAMPLTWVAPFWVKHLVRADLARQMAAGDWKDALGVAENAIETWFSVRGVQPVWHMDGIAGTNEVQTVTITGTPTGGTFTLTYSGQTTAPIAYNATAATVKSALAALSNLDAIDITVTGGPGPGTAYVVTFDGSDSEGVNVAEMTSTGSFSGGSSPAVSVATTTGGDGAITVNGVTIPSQTYDNVAAGAAIPGFPGKIDSLLYPKGSWAFLNGGSLDLGLVRDSQLNARNRYRQFQETFEGAAFRGVESLRLVMEVEPTGQTSGTKDLNAIAD